MRHLDFEIMKVAKGTKLIRLRNIESEVNGDVKNNRKLKTEALTVLKEIDEEAQRIFSETDSFRQTALILGLNLQQVIYLVKSEQAEKEKLFLNFFSK